ncbi:MAG: calcium/sodium antiporter [Desulfobacterales bacterium]|nr:calcium/sodium antiporter [Desulfobacterales bacterium]MBL7101231.1 calcium/sodium antiporter [Desulfobacteraceae bacterium]MBL7172290.1 calcium/sodium antiporter [Desulfobacteraceae bacterium]
MLQTFLSLLAGLFGLYVGAEGLVRGSASLASQLGLSRLVIGLTVVAFGTSTPELVVSIKAAHDGLFAISLGNIVGSNICNIALILGLSALIKPIRIHAQVVRLQIPIMILISLILMLLLLNGRLSRLEGAGLFLGIVFYTGYSLHLARKENRRSNAKESGESVKGPRASLWVSALFVAGGLGLLMAGAKFFLTGAVSLARILGVSEAFIGLTIVAIGTSLPELATSIMAVVKKEGDIAVGNVVGSNIFNILCILGVSSLVQPIQMAGISLTDLGVMTATAILVLPMARSGFLLARWEGAILLAVYGAYIYYLSSLMAS